MDNRMKSDQWYTYRGIYQLYIKKNHTKLYVACSAWQMQETEWYMCIDNEVSTSLSTEILKEAFSKLLYQSSH